MSPPFNIRLTKLLKAIYETEKKDGKFQNGILLHCTSTCNSLPFNAIRQSKQHFIEEFTIPSMELSRVTTYTLTDLIKVHWPSCACFISAFENSSGTQGECLNNILIKSSWIASIGNTQKSFCMQTWLGKESILQLTACFMADIYSETKNQFLGFFSISLSLPLFRTLSCTQLKDDA